MKYRYKVLLLLIALLSYKTAAYFVNQADYAEVYTYDCIGLGDKEKCVYKGKLKRTFISNDYIVDTGEQVITITKQDVLAVKTYKEE